MVNTFVTCDTPDACARSLDWRRLGKQRVEARQIYNALTGATKGWRNHPAARMWEGFEGGLALYHNAVIEEWVERGYRNNMPLLPVPEDAKLPWWFTWKPLQNSHRASLNRKDASHYKFDVPADYTSRGYVWPHKVPDSIRAAQDPSPDSVCEPLVQVAGKRKRVLAK